MQGFRQFIGKILTRPVFADRPRDSRAGEMVLSGGGGKIAREACLWQQLTAHPGTPAASERRGRREMIRPVEPETGRSCHRSSPQTEKTTAPRLWEAAQIPSQRVAWFLRLRSAFRACFRGKTYPTAGLQAIAAAWLWEHKQATTFQILLSCLLDLQHPYGQPPVLQRQGISQGGHRSAC